MHTKTSVVQGTENLAPRRIAGSCHLANLIAPSQSRWPSMMKFSWRIPRRMSPSKIGHTCWFIKPALANVRALCDDAVHLSVCLSVSRLKRIHKMRFSQKKLTSLELWRLFTIYRKSYMGFQRTQYWIPTMILSDGKPLPVTHVPHR